MTTAATRQPVWLNFQSSRPLQPIILCFKGKGNGNHRFLSNFEEAEVTLPAELVLFGGYHDNHEAMVFPASENAYMAWKTGSRKFRKMLQDMKAPAAKDLSRTLEFIATHRNDYCDETRVVAMYRILQQKFDLERHPALAQRLLDTEDSTLIEGNTWEDDLFGFDMLTGMGQNYLGRILMTIRDELRSKTGLIPLLPRRNLPDTVILSAWPLHQPFTT